MRLAVFTKNSTNPAYAAARIGAERTASRHGARVTHYVPQKADDVGEQIALIDDALAAKPDAFIFVPVHVSAIDEAIARIHAAGVPVVNYLNRLTTGRYVTFVGADDYALGRAIAEYLAKTLSGRGKLVLIEGMPGSTTSIDRMKGFTDILKHYPDIERLATLQGEYQETAGRNAMASFLAASQAPPDAVLAANDAMALGALAALEARGMRALVTGVNALPDAIHAIKRGTLLATADFDALKISCIATEAAIRHLRGESVPREISLPVQIVDRSNYAAWDKPLEERECPRWEDAMRIIPA
jgi:ribose transport system substrate-binding protein